MSDEFENVCHTISWKPIVEAVPQLENVDREPAGGKQGNDDGDHLGRLASTRSARFGVTTCQLRHGGTLSIDDGGVIGGQRGDFR